MKRWSIPLCWLAVVAAWLSLGVAPAARGIHVGAASWIEILDQLGATGSQALGLVVSVGLVQVSVGKWVRNPRSWFAALRSIAFGIQSIGLMLAQRIELSSPWLGAFALASLLGAAIGGLEARAQALPAARWALPLSLAVSSLSQLALWTLSGPWSRAAHEVITFTSAALFALGIKSLLTRDKMPTWLSAIVAMLPLFLIQTARVASLPEVGSGVLWSGRSLLSLAAEFRGSPSQLDLYLICASTLGCLGCSAYPCGERGYSVYLFGACLLTLGAKAPLLLATLSLLDRLVESESNLSSGR